MMAVLREAMLLPLYLHKHAPQQRPPAETLGRNSSTPLS